jgi:hypothetical protein
MELNDYLHLISELRGKLYERVQTKEAAGHWVEYGDPSDVSVPSGSDWIEDSSAEYSYEPQAHIQSSLEDIALNAPYLKARKEAEEALGYHSSPSSYELHANIQKNICPIMRNTILASIALGGLLGTLGGGLVYYILETLKR